MNVIFNYRIPFPVVPRGTLVPRWLLTRAAWLPVSPGRQIGSSFIFLPLYRAYFLLAPGRIIFRSALHYFGGNDSLSSVTVVGSSPSLASLMVDGIALSFRAGSGNTE